MTFAELIERHRLVVCVGTGGVGKTTLSAALALGAALRGRRVMVLTIDPAHALGRAFGVPVLGSEPEPIVVPESVRTSSFRSLDAAMLSTQQSWAALVTRHAPSKAVADAVLANVFYQQLTSRFAGATEYAAMEELLRLHESGRFDLVVLDTPPAAHAFDFVRAPERLERLFDPELARWLVQPAMVLGRGAARATSTTVRFLVHRLQRATGRRTLQDIAEFFSAFGQMLSEVRQRSRAAKALLRAPETTFVLVTVPRQEVLVQSRDFVREARALGVPLGAVVVNRVQARALAEGEHLDAGPSPEAREILRQLARLGFSEPELAWLGRAHRDARELASIEGRRLRAFVESLPVTTTHALVPELDRDLHTLGDLALVAEGLYAEPAALSDQAEEC